jgi:single-stranded-DNA-specific exonuclease
VLTVAAGNEEVTALLESELHIPRLLAHILSVRGIHTPAEAQSFLFPRIEHLSDPMLLPDVERGIERVVTAVRTGERIGIFGDYDADGVTSTALMINFLNQAGGHVEHYLPRRDEGYGLNERGVEALKERGVSLLICLDCGSTNTGEIGLARKIGLDVIVIDHHEMGADLPDALAIVNPKRQDSAFPTRELAACGVTFFFLLALRRALHHAGTGAARINLKRELDLVALGTVADMVPLQGDNRLFVKFGVEMMEKKPRSWMKAFIRRGLVKKGRLDNYALSFLIIPRINAAGRVSDPELALSFLTCEEEGECDRLYLALDGANRQRQGVEEGIIREAKGMIEREGFENNASLVLFNETWSIGVIGIAAQKLAEGFGKPSVIMTRVDGVIKGSARSIEGLDLHRLITSLSPTLLKYGGHRFACGISLLEENIASFSSGFESGVARSLQDYTRDVRVDGLMEFTELTGDVVESLEMLAPFGVGNPRPTFLFSPAAVSVNNRFVKLTDSADRIWHGFLQKPSRVDEPHVPKVVASPTIRKEMGESFINLQIREFVVET